MFSVFGGMWASPEIVGSWGEGPPSIRKTDSVLPPKEPYRTTPYTTRVTLILFSRFDFFHWGASKIHDFFIFEPRPLGRHFCHTISHNRELVRTYTTLRLWVRVSRTHFAAARIAKPVANRDSVLGNC